MLASGSAILCGVLLVCNFVPRDQQTAALDSYVEALQGGLSGLTQNIERLQQIKGNLNIVWQQKRNIALRVPDAGFVAALDQVQVQLEQYFAAYIADASVIVGALDAWIRAARDTFLAQTASYQGQRDLLLASFNDSIAAGPGMRRRCAQHYYIQFEGIEFNYLLASGKPYANAAGVLAEKSAGISLLQNMGEADAMRQLVAFEPAETQLQDAIDNWNTFFSRITIASANIIDDLKMAVLGVIANVDASINVPNSLLLSVRQLRNAYNLCVNIG